MANLVGTTVTGDLAVTGSMGGQGAVPVGGIIAVHSGMTGAYSLPGSGAVDANGWMLCDGQSVPSSQTISGTLPTLTDARFLQGNTHANVGGTGGDTIPAHTHTGAAHTHTGAAHQHTSAAHQHTGASHQHTGPNHSHSGPNHSHTGPNHTHSMTHDHSNGGSHQHSGKSGSGIQGGTNPHMVSSVNHSWNVTSINYANVDLGNQGFTTGNSGTGGTSNSGTGSTGNSGTGDTGATTPGGGGSTTPGATGSTTPGASSSTTPGAGGSFGTGSAVLPKFLRVVYLMRVI